MLHYAYIYIYIYIYVSDEEQQDLGWRHFKGAFAFCIEPESPFWDFGQTPNVQYPYPMPMPKGDRCREAICSFHMFSAGFEVSVETNIPMPLPVLKSG